MGRSIVDAQTETQTETQTARTAPVAPAMPRSIPGRSIAGCYARATSAAEQRALDAYVALTKAETRARTAYRRSRKLATRERNIAAWLRAAEQRALASAALLDEYRRTRNLRAVLRFTLFVADDVEIMRLAQRMSAAEQRARAIEHERALLALVDSMLDA